MVSISITGWGKNGPSYDVYGSKLDRNQTHWISGVVDSKKSSGKPDKGPAHKYVTHGNHKWVVFKKGHNYKLLVKSDGVVSEIDVDAKNSHISMPVDPGVSLKVESEKPQDD